MGEEYVLVCISNGKYVEFPADKPAEIISNKLECQIATAFIMMNSHNITEGHRYAFVGKSTFYDEEKKLYEKLTDATAEVLAYLIEQDCIDINNLHIFHAGWIYRKFEKANMLDELKEILSRKEGEK